MKNHWNLFLKFDAIGLGVFTAIGSIFAYKLFGLDFLAMTFSAKTERDRRRRVKRFIC